MKVITVLTTFGEIIGRVDPSAVSLFSSLVEPDFPLDIEKPVLIVPIMSERGPGVSFRPVMVSSKLEKISLHRAAVAHLENNPPKQLVDEYLQMTSGIILSGV